MPWPSGGYWLAVSLGQILVCHRGQGGGARLDSSALVCDLNMFVWVSKHKYMGINMWVVVYVCVCVYITFCEPSKYIPTHDIVKVLWLIPGNFFFTQAWAVHNSVASFFILFWVGGRSFWVLRVNHHIVMLISWLHIVLQVLCKSYPSEFVSYFHYCRSLRFEDKPDYSYLKRLFRDLFIREGTCLWLQATNMRLYISWWSFTLFDFSFCFANSLVKCYL